MSSDIVLGLLIQAVAVLLIFVRLGRTWIRHIGAIFVVMAVIYHGVGEILIALFPGQDPYRPLIDPQYVDDFVLLISVAILLFALAYVIAIGKRQDMPPTFDSADAQLTTRLFDWRLMAIITIPLLALTADGQGYGSNGGAQGTGVAVTLGLVQQFFVIGIVLTSFALAMRLGSRSVLWLLVLQSVVLALSGERAVIAIAAVLLVAVLSKFGVHSSRKQLVTGLLLLLVFGWVITSARAAEGRFATTAGSTIRLQFIGEGIRHLTSAQTREQIAFTLGSRLDGNSFGALELQALHSGSSPVGLTPLKNDLLLALPSFLNPNKDSEDVGTRVEKVYVEEHLPIYELEQPGNTYEDIVPTQLGGLTGIIGPQFMLVVSFLLGLGFAGADRWLRRERGPMRTLIFIGLLGCVLDYEGSWDEYTTTARGILLLLIIVGALVGLRALARRGLGPAGRLSQNPVVALQSFMPNQSGLEEDSVTAAALRE
jgi:hypothetical protein